MATTRKTTASKPDADNAPAVAAEPTVEDNDTSYIDAAGKLAADTRQLAEDMREKVGELVDACRDLNQNNEPRAQDFAAANSVRRIPMAVADVSRALDSLVSAAADLARDTAR